VRIEICGNIASGKTTLAKGLATCGLTPVEEKYLTNPFIHSFYSDPKKYSFETEITFLLQHYHAIKTSSQSKPLVCDYSLTLDKAYADVTLPPPRRKLFFSIAQELESEIGPPSRIIYLKCPEEVLLNRIQKRNRSFESSIDISYLQALSKAIDVRMKGMANMVDVLEINSHEINFVTNIGHIVALVSICQHNSV
jgi:deoxyadenosine/deoxycytidine kinase